MDTKYIVYWTTPSGPNSQPIDHLSVALAFTETLRNKAKAGENISFITMAAENPHQVGSMGVDSVENGKTPDGVDYTWTKRRVTETRF